MTLGSGANFEAQVMASAHERFWGPGLKGSLMQWTKLIQETFIHRYLDKLLNLELELVDYSKKYSHGKKNLQL